jgi:hypothetical protein
MSGGPPQPSSGMPSSPGAASESAAESEPDRGRVDAARAAITSPPERGAPAAATCQA